ncbi:hypothetical protein NSND_60921 [Nitrospira sp. ND1]|nr:hypothetical protein NSND_60921 [Nitrospira sp. ND1]
MVALRLVAPCHASLPEMGDTSPRYFTTSLGLKPATPRNGSWQLLTIRIHVLSFFRRYGFNSGGERLMSREIDRPVFCCCARRVLAKKVVAFPVLRGPDGSGHETATTVRVDIA